MTECEIQVDDDGQITIPVGHIIDCLYERDEESVLEWIHDKFPHGIGLYD